MTLLLTPEDKVYLTQWIFQYLDRSTEAYNNGSLSNQDRADHIIGLVEGQLKAQLAEVLKHRSTPEFRGEMAEWLFKDSLHPTRKIDWKTIWDKQTEKTKEFYLDKADQLLTLFDNYYK